MAKANSNPTTSRSRRDAVNLIVGGAAGVVAAGATIASATTASSDPVFGMIERHRAEKARASLLETACEEAYCRVLGPEEDRSERYSHAEIRQIVNEPEVARSYDAWNAATDKLLLTGRNLFKTEPVTLAGAAAQLKYAAEVVQEELGESTEGTLIDVLLTVASGLSKLTEGGHG